MQKHTHDRYNRQDHARRRRARARHHLVDAGRVRAHYVPGIDGAAADIMAGRLGQWSGGELLGVQMAVEDAPDRQLGRGRSLPAGVSVQRGTADRTFCRCAGETAAPR